MKGISDWHTPAIAVIIFVVWLCGFFSLCILHCACTAHGFLLLCRMEVTWRAVKWAQRHKYGPKLHLPQHKLILSSASNSVCVKLKDKSNWFRSQFRPALLNLFHFTLLCQWSSNLVCKTSLLCESGPLEQMLLPVPICTLTADVCFLCHKLRLHYKADFSFENVSSSISTDLEGMFSWIIQPYKEPGRNTP